MTANPGSHPPAGGSAPAVSACMVSFHGTVAPTWVLDGVRDGRIAAICLFAYNIESAPQLRQLTDALKRAAASGGQAPPLIGLDQEGGQLMAFQDGTPLPGNMALGATRSPELAKACGKVLGREVLALGCNLNFAPVVDLAQQHDSNVVGLRAFSDDPKLSGELGAALVRGMQAQGVLATAKHFPGHGGTADDSHHAAPSVARTRPRLEAEELAPFRAVVAAGVAAVMTAHVRFPALDELPATVSRPILNGLLRRELGFAGLVLTDAMDMAAMASWPPLERCAMAIEAGADLVMLGHLDDQDALCRQLTHAAGTDAARRIADARAKLPRSEADLSVIAGPEHREVAARVAAAATTVLRGAELLPWRPTGTDDVVLITVEAGNLTPAETASSSHHTLQRQLARRLPRLRSTTLPFSASAERRSEALAASAGATRVIVATVNANHDPSQVALVAELARRGQDPIVLPLRSPLDVAALPSARVVVCAYGRHEAQTEAVVRVLFGEAVAHGTLPISRERSSLTRTAAP